ncbi:MAG TPA: phosphate--acyl-ACP acyltransferase, partial [Acidimicrobiia bacterium]|nr:phosphate--acyl-ACP acyltransferase [Acidimicrobiia bacterium]
MGTSRITVAVDAMGGDHAPGEIVRGALDAVTELDVDVLLVGQEPSVVPLLPDCGVAGVEVQHAEEIVAMDEDPAAAARRKKDSSLVRCAQAVREGRAQAMVGAGNTGATMAAALLRMGRIRGIARPAIAVPIPVPAGTRHQLLIDGGSTVDCTPEWLAQF